MPRYQQPLRNRPINRPRQLYTDHRYTAADAGLQAPNLISVIVAC